MAKKHKGGGEHILSIRQELFEPAGEGTAVCTCGKSQGIAGVDFDDLRQAADAWHREHTEESGGLVVSYTDRAEGRW